VRVAFIRTLTELAERDPRILLLTGDLGYKVIEPFAERFPTRFYNVGVAEQSMVGLATGLSEAGFLPFAYSIATFASMRAYEFLRNGPVLHGLPVRLVGVGGGFEYGHAGMTHHNLEDVALMRVQPGLTVLTPADPRQAVSCLAATWSLPGPVYYRIGKNDTAVVAGLDGRFRLGQVELVGDGTDVLILAMGAAAVNAVDASRRLAERNIASTVGVVSTVSPVPAEDFVRLLSRFPAALTVEAHYVTGGLGSVVSEIVAELGLRCRIIRCGVRGEPRAVIGSQSYLERAHGLSADQLAAIAEAALRPND
jgi:transketolase